MVNDKQIRERIRDYLIEATLSDGNAIQDDTLLFDQGIFDSMGLLQLIDFLREEFDVHTNDNELVIENFESLNSIVRYVLDKISS